MTGRHIEPAQERSVDARIARLQERTKGAMHAAKAVGEPTGPYTIVLGLLDLLKDEL